MEPKKFSKILSLLLVTFLLSSCVSQKPLEIRTTPIENQIPIQPSPKPLTMNNVTFYVVTENNFEDFKKRFLKENGSLVFYAISVQDYEALSLNLSDIERYILQQKQIIIFYEKAITNDITEGKQ